MSKKLIIVQEHVAWWSAAVEDRILDPAELSPATSVWLGESASGVWWRRVSLSFTTCACSSTGWLRFTCSILFEDACKSPDSSSYDVPRWNTSGTDLIIHGIPTCGLPIILMGTRSFDHLCLVNVRCVLISDQLIRSLDIENCLTAAAVRLNLR
jgi:hypothetical protein